MEKLITCLKCGGPLCYETLHESVKAWNCLGCGYTSLSLLKDGSDYQKQYEETLPELFIDLKYVDLENKAWYPVVLNYPDKGIIFANGASKENWRWTAMIATEVKESEKDKFKKPGVENEYFKYKMDPKTTKDFDRNDFISAVGYIKLYE